MLESLFLGAACYLMGLTVWNNWLSVMDLLVPRDLTSPYENRMRPFVRTFARMCGAIFTGLGAGLLTFSAIRAVHHFTDT